MRNSVLSPDEFLGTGSRIGSWGKGLVVSGIEVPETRDDLVDSGVLWKALKESAEDA